MSKPIRIALVLVVLLAGAGVGAYFLFFSGDDAPEASLDNALGGATTTTVADGDTSTPPASLEGTWQVQPSQEIDFEASSGTFAGFRIEEELGGIGATQAVGRTGQVTGSMTIAGSTVTAATFDVDLTSIQSNESRREGKIQDALETDQFPTATFELTSPIELGDDAAGGAEQSVTATGDLTIHGVTKSVEFPLKAKLAGDTVAVAGSLDITFADYGVEVPTAPIVLSVEDHGPIELQLLLKQG